MVNTHNLSSLIWSSADDVLRGLFKPSEYGRVILPFVVMRRLDCVLEPKKDEVYELYNKYKEQLSDPSPVILRQVGLPFFNTSKFDLSRLKSDPTNVLLNFNNYVQGYSQNVLDIIENFSIAPLVEKLQKNNRLYLLIDKFTEFDLHPDKIDNHQMGSVYEELLRKFSEMSNEESGDHFTPRDVVNLLVRLVFEPQKQSLEKEGTIRSVFDPCCGTGGMLTLGKEWIKNNISNDLKVILYGQELNDITYSICKSDLLLLGEDDGNIHGPTSSLSDDRVPGKTFDFLITNPPFGVSWKSEREFVEEEAKDPQGRFSAGTPKVSDGSLLFLQHLIHKMNPSGARIGVIFNGSPLSSGDAESGESNIRKWVLENDLIEAIICLPDNLFFNTDITTYIWILNNKKENHRKGLIQLINASERYSFLKQPLGDKKKEITEEDVKFIYDQYAQFRETSVSKLLPLIEFKYRKITIESPLISDEGKIQRKTNNSVISDPKLRDVEYIPYTTDLKKYFENNFEKYSPRFWIDHSKTKFGYEIGFNRYFHENLSLPSHRKILTEIDELDIKIHELRIKIDSYTEKGLDVITSGTEASVKKLIVE